MLNLTHALQFRDLFGIDLSPDFRAPRTLLRRAQSFYAEYEEIKDDRRPGEEYELIQDWAEDLQVDAYFELVNESPLRPQRDVLSDIEADPLNLLDPERKSNRLSLATSPAGTMAVTMYLVDAINLFAEQERDFIQRVSFEISMLGTYGLDPSDPERKYSLKSLPGRKFSALQLLAILYAGMSALDPSVDTGLDFGDEYTLAKKLAGMPAK